MQTEIILLCVLKLLAITIHTNLLQIKCWLLPEWHEAEIYEYFLQQNNWKTQKRWI